MSTCCSQDPVLDALLEGALHGLWEGCMDHMQVLARALVYAVEAHRERSGLPPIWPVFHYGPDQHLQVSYQREGRKLSFRVDGVYPETRLRYGDGRWVLLSWHTIHIPLHWLLTSLELAERNSDGA